MAFSKSSEEATNTVQAALGKMITALKAEGVGEKMIRSHDIDKSAVRSRDNDTNKALEILGYEVSRKVELKLPDLANYPEIVRVLMTADHITNMSSNFDTSTREDVEAELTGEACLKARKKADLLAKGAGVTIDRVYAVSNHSLEAVRLTPVLGWGWDTAGAQCRRSLPESPALPLKGLRRCMDFLRLLRIHKLQEFELRLTDCDRVRQVPAETRARTKRGRFGHFDSSDG